MICNSHFHHRMAEKAFSQSYTVVEFKTIMKSMMYSAVESKNAYNTDKFNING